MEYPIGFDAATDSRPPPHPTNQRHANAGSGGVPGAIGGGVGERDERTDRFFDQLHGAVRDAGDIRPVGGVDGAFGERATDEGVEVAGDHVEFHGGA